MDNILPPTDRTRRELFRIIGQSMVLTAAGSGVLSPALAQHVHVALADAKSLSGGVNYQPQAFTKHNFQTLRTLAEIVIPGASDGGAAEYIDFLSSRNTDLAAIFNGGFGWLDDYMQKKYSADFLTAKPAEQTAVLDTLAYKANYVPETAGGLLFWTWLRNMVVDAYYTSPAGVNDVGFMGNRVMAEFSVPKEAVDYAIKHSPFANEG
jgi:gluconate 2-dehydrogenase gamma chain